MPDHVTSALVLILPWPLLLVGLLAGRAADRHARRVRRLTQGAASFAVFAALLAALSYRWGTARSVTYVAVALPAGLGRLAINVYVNALTVLMILLVSFVGVIVACYSSRYMDGDAHEGRFHRWLSLTLGAFFTLIVAGNIWGFFLSWLVTSLSLHELLAFYRERPGAVLAARKKYLLHRLSDVALFVAFVLVIHTLRTSQFAGLGPALAARPGPLSAPLEIAAGLILLSAVLKSAQFPTHGWLIQVMEAPTPVSALMHAGIIYTGAFLLLRTSLLIARVDWVWDVLIVGGLASVAAASLMMMTATNIKESLAYSTCAQMGFMLMECGLGLYSVAVLHIIAHSVYKAHAFLSSGSVVDTFRAPVPSGVPRPTTVVAGVGALAAATAATIGAGALFGVTLQREPALIAVGAVLTAAMAQLLLQAFRARSSGTAGVLWRLAVLCVFVALAYFGLHRLFVHLLGTSLPSDRLQAHGVPPALLWLIAAVFLGLLLLQQALPRIREQPLGQAAWVHLYNDLYVDDFLSRLVHWLERSARMRGFRPSLRRPPRDASS